MLDEHNILRLSDKNHERDLLVEVNWNGKKDPLTGDCRVLRIHLPDGTQSFIDREDLMSLLFVLGDAQEQRRLIPSTTRTVRWHESVFQIKATRDIAKGENIVVAGKMSCDNVRSEEMITRGERNRRLVSAGGLVLPRQQ